MRTPFDPAPVVADVLHLLAHPGELRDEREWSMCGTCAGSGCIVNPGTKCYERCWICDGQGIR